MGIQGLVFQFMHSIGVPRTGILPHSPRPDGAPASNQDLVARDDGTVQGTTRPTQVCQLVLLQVSAEFCGVDATWLLESR